MQKLASIIYCPLLRSVLCKAHAFRAVTCGSISPALSRVLAQQSLRQLVRHAGLACIAKVLLPSFEAFFFFRKSRLARITRGLPIIVAPGRIE